MAGRRFHERRLALGLCFASLFCVFLLQHAEAEAAEERRCGDALQAVYQESWGLPAAPEDIDLADLRAACEIEDLAGAEGKATALTYDGLKAYAEGGEKTALARWKAAAALDSDLAMVALGDAALRRGDVPDLSEVHDWYRQAADAESPLGMSKLGWLYQRGYHVEEDPAQSMDWYLRAAEAREPTAMYYLAGFYMQGIVVAQDIQLSIQWYGWAAEAGSAQAYHSLGEIYDEGSLVPEDDERAGYYYRLAAFGGVPEAMLELGEMHDQGSGVPQDHAEAAHWYQRALDEGVAEAGHGLGLLYYQGLGVEADSGIALSYFIISAEAGKPESMASAGTLAMEQGDYQVAYFWCVLAARHGMQTLVSFRIVELQALLPDEVLVETERKAQVWTAGAPAGKGPVRF